MKSSIFISLAFASALNADVKINDELTLSGYATVTAKPTQTKTTRIWVEPTFLNFQLSIELQTIKFEEIALEFKIPEAIITKEILESMAPARLPLFEPSCIQ